jgi:energy-coupling factor transport system permease protein
MKAFIYCDVDSSLHRLSPVTKIMALAALFIISMIFNDPVYLTFVALAILALCFMAKILPALWKIKAMLILLFLFPTCLWSVYLDGSTQIAGLGPVDITREGFLYGLAMGLRLTGMLVAGLILLGTTKVEDFASGLHKLGIPYRISFSLTLAFRLVPLFFSTFQIITQAQQSRGLAIHSGHFLKRIKKTLPILIPVFVSGIRRTDQLAIALESKGFGFQKNRTCLNPVRITSSDKILLVIFGILVISAVVMRVAGFGKL